MLNQEFLKDARRLANSCLDGSFEDTTNEEQDLAKIIIDLLEELDRKNNVHRQEQRRSADRLSIAMDGVKTYVADPKAQRKLQEAIERVGTGE